MAYKFIKTPAVWSNGKSMDSVTATIEIEQEATLLELIESFESFLKASGFVFDGKLDLTADDDE